MSRPAAPARGDLRFADPAWQENPFYRRLGQAYLAMEKAVTGAVERAGLDEPAKEKARLAAAVLVSALAPVNTLPGNPAALKRAFDTGGLSLARGARNLLADVRTGRLTPRQVDTRPFTLGENLGVTPGAVVFRNEVVEIIEYAVSQGFRVFVTSWRNPGRAQSGWDLDTYAAALLAAMDAVAEISGSEQIGTMGLCAGGQLLAATLGHLAARDDHRVAYACFGVSQLDLSVPGVTGLMTAQPLSGLARLTTGAAGMVDGSGIAAGFAWLRPSELVWSHWVNNYLMGQDPPAFDILAWNDDSTRLPGALVRQLLGIAEGNLLAAPGGVTLLGTPVDLAEVKVPAYVVGAETDHLVPWAASYQTTRLLGGENTFVLSGGGHIQHLVNPPGNPKARYRTGPVTSGDPQAWLAAATSHPGTWWDHWARWTHDRSGALRPAPANLGSERHRPLEPAPGRYAKEK